MDSKYPETSKAAGQLAGPSRETEERPVGEIESLLHDQEQQLEKLGGMIERVFARLNPVLDTGDRDVRAESPARVQPVSMIGNRLENSNNTIRNYQVILSELVERTQV